MDKEDRGKRKGIERTHSTWCFDIEHEWDSEAKIILVF